MALCYFIWYWKTKPKFLVFKNQFRKLDSSHYTVHIVISISIYQNRKINLHLVVLLR